MPAHAVGVRQQNADASANRQALEQWIVQPEFFDPQLLNALLVSIEARDQRIDGGQLTLDREGEADDRAFHTLEHVDAHQVD